MEKERDIINADIDADLDEQETKKKNKKGIIIIIVVLLILSVITTFILILFDNKEPAVNEITTTQVSEWNENYIGTDEGNAEKYPDHALPPLTVD